MSVPNLLGPIDTGQGFMLTTIISGTPYVLNGSATGYYWESNISTLLLGTTLGIFSASGTPNNAVLADTVNKGWLAINDNGIVINSSVMSSLIFNQNSYATWFPPTIFLSMADYTLSAVNGKIGQIAINNTTIPADNIYILPILWYFNCIDGKYNYINRPLGSVINWFCNVNPGITGCSATGTVHSGYTNLSDCTQNFEYNYCEINTTCGTNNCNGPCSASNYDCTLSASKTYVCMDTENNWWTSPLFIFGIIGLLLIISIILGIVGYLIWRKKKNKKTDTESLTEPQ